MSKQKTKGAIRETIEALVIAIGLATFLRFFIVAPFTIPSGSMLETIQIGDYLLVNNLSYGLKLPFSGTWIYKGDGPEHGDVIVFKYPGDPSIDYIKRVIGLPGDTLEIRNKVVYRNGVALEEDYTQFTRPSYPNSRLDNMPIITIPEDSYFVMGDNRDNSQDSRVWGTVHRDAIHGKSWRIYWSWDDENTKPRLSRLGQKLE